MTNRQLAAIIVDAVLADLGARQGIGDAIDSVKYDHADVYNGELLPDLRAVVEHELDKELLK
jgi:hypothetical protein